MKIARLGDHVTFLSGFAFKSGLFNETEDGFPVVRIRDVVRGHSETFYSGDYSDRYVVEKNDYLIGMDGEFNLARWQSGPALLNQRVCKIESTSSSLNVDYLGRYLSVVLKEIEADTPFVTVKHLSVKKLNEIQIPLPPLAEQKRIAAILDVTDALRAKRRASLAQLDTLLQATFLDMFGDPVINPKGWEVATLGEIIKVKSGNGLVAKDMAPTGQYPVYGGNGINGYHDSYMFKEPKIVLGRVGVYCGSVHLTKPNAWITDNALYVEKLLKPMETGYLLEALRVADLNQYAGRAAQPLISGSRIYPVAMLSPPLELQRRFTNIVESVAQQKNRVREHLAKLDTLFASLQSRAFNGEL